MRSRALHRAAVASALLLWFSANPGCAQVAGINDPASATCANGVKDADEDGVDCGGVCVGACPGARCGAPADCASGKCAADKTCAEPTCHDGVLNGKETSVDCGGTCGCDGDKCTQHPDCQSGICLGGLCRPATCFNNKPDPAESGKDCGGPCLKCNGAECTMNGDCASGRCNPMTHLCECNYCSAVLTNDVPIVESGLCPASALKLTSLLGCLCLGKCANVCNYCTPITSLDAPACKACAQPGGMCESEADSCRQDQPPLP